MISEETRLRIRAAMETSPEFERVSIGMSELASTINQLSNRIQTGFGVLDLSTSGVIDAERAIEASKNIFASIATGTVNSALLLYTRNYIMNFSFITEPSMQAAASSLGGYYDVLVRGVAEQERLAQQYRVMFLQGASTLALAGAVHLINAVMRPTSAALASRVAASAAQSVGTNALLKRLAGVRAYLGRISVGARSGVLGVAGFVLWDLVQSAARNKFLTEMAQNRALMDFFNPKSLMSIYQKNAFLLGTESIRGEADGMRALIGTDWEDRVARGELSDEPINSWTGRVYNAAMSGSFSELHEGFDVRGFGFDSERVLDVTRALERNVQTGANEDIVAHILSMSGLYAGGDTSQMESIASQIIRSSSFTDSDVQDATARFEEFFAAVVGDGRPQASHLNLVEALASFSYEYALGFRANLDSTTEVARIQQFMGDGGYINGRFDVTATKTAITSIDELLLKGATYQDLGAVQIFNSLAISQEDAIRGVTYNAETFDKFLGGLQDFLGVSSEDILSRNRNFDTALQNFAMMTGMDSGGLNSIIVALSRYAEGHRVEDIRQEYTQGTAEDVDSRLEPFRQASGIYENALEIVGNLVYSNNKLLDTIDANLDVISTMNEILSEVYERGLSGAIPVFLDSVRRVLGFATSYQLIEERNRLLDTSSLLGNLMSPESVIEGYNSEISLLGEQRRSMYEQGRLDEVRELGIQIDDLIEQRDEFDRLRLDFDPYQVEDPGYAERRLPEIEEELTEMGFVKVGDDFVHRVQVPIGEEEEEEEEEVETGGTSVRSFSPLEFVAGLFSIAHAHGAPEHISYAEFDPPHAELRSIEEPISGIYGLDDKIKNTLRLIDRYEASGDYNALLNFSNREGGEFSHIRVSEMTLEEVIRFTSQRGAGSYHGWSIVNMPEGTEAHANGWGSTPVGRYQFVGTTLKDVADRGNFDTSRTFNKNLQDEMFLWYARSNILGHSEDEQVRRLRSLWEGLRNAPRDDVLEMARELQSLAVGGMAFPDRSVPGAANKTVKQTNMHISIPIVSKNPYMSARMFSDYMKSRLQA